MEQRYTFIKTNEIKDDTMSEEERVEIEAVIEEHDMDALAEKLTNFLAGIGHSDKIVEIKNILMHQLMKRT